MREEEESREIVWGEGKMWVDQAEWKFVTHSRANSRCCFWSEPTGTWVERWRRMSAAWRIG